MSSFWGFFLLTNLVDLLTTLLNVLTLKLFLLTFVHQLLKVADICGKIIL